MIHFNFIQTTNELEKQCFNFLEEWNNSADSIALKTSGSTGKPKTILLKKSHVLASSKRTNNFFNLNTSSKALLCISPEFIGGKMMLVRALSANMSLYVTNISGNPLTDLNETIDFAAMVPYQVMKIIAETPEKLNQIKHLIIGGAPVSKNLEDALQSFNCSAYATFGMTETISHIALKKLDGKNSPFRAMEGVSLITDDLQRLTISDPLIGIEQLSTNDCVNLIDHQTFYWLGRSDFVVNSGGIKLHPEMIERKIHPVLANLDFFVIGVPDNLLGQKLIGVSKKTLSGQQLTAIQRLLSKYERPKKWFVVENFVLTSSGKLNRLATLANLPLD